MNTKQDEKKIAFQILKKIIDKGGPKEEEYQDLESSISTLANLSTDTTLLEKEISPLIDSCDFLASRNSVMGHIRTKPYGYAGDFEIIERIYQEEIKKEEFRLWDIYSLKHPAASAVRNRKKYFKKEIVNKLSENSDLKLLNVASGPGRDLFEIYEALRSNQKITTTCVEMDNNAIQYAKTLNEKYKDQITFIHKNIFRFNSDERYDLIWSAGLFDYFFEDKVFEKLLKVFGQWLEPGGEIIIGNFNSEHNPSRQFMEIFGDWHLNHRSEADLMRIAYNAGFRNSQVSVGREPENINLFLHIKL